VTLHLESRVQSAELSDAYPTLIEKAAVLINHLAPVRPLREATIGEISLWLERRT
jgi:hypothetical protein